MAREVVRVCSQPEEVARDPLAVPRGHPDVGRPARRLEPEKSFPRPKGVRQVVAARGQIVEAVGQSP